MQQANKTHEDHEIYGMRLERRSRVVTTLLHLQEISPRDLGMTTKKRGITKLLILQTSETRNLERLNNLKEIR